ncbi:unnamed protein product [Protopolystoma xenopodis]|uniref:Uncharacterized protein n=1 Tax=Protopolystoma xenopodis TaxID=117903 RepID=A0A448XLY7_9PLAT|nr:unnamed protein product [Protopolystoma xenopodis]
MPASPARHWHRHQQHQQHHRHFHQTGLSGLAWPPACLGHNIHSGLVNEAAAAATHQLGRDAFVTVQVGLKSPSLHFTVGNISSHRSAHQPICLVVLGLFELFPFFIFKSSKAVGTTAADDDDNEDDGIAGTNEMFSSSLPDE